MLEPMYEPPAPRDRVLRYYKGMLTGPTLLGNTICYSLIYFTLGWRWMVGVLMVSFIAFPMLRWNLSQAEMERYLEQKRKEEGN